MNVAENTDISYYSRAHVAGPTNAQPHCKSSSLTIRTIFVKSANKN